jgi:serine/threonine protein kinase
MQGADSKGSPDARNTRKQSCIGAPLLAAKGVSGWSDISDERGPAQPSLTLFAKQSFISLYADTGAVLGQGVTGEIRVCMRTSDHRSFAYKVLPFGLDSVREMRIWQSLLPHPNIVPIVDAFDELVLPGHPLAKYVSGGQGGRVIIAVMPRMEHDLLSLVRHRSLSDDEVREITRQILAGVAHMHANGFVHNDIKLENVLVVPATMCASGLHDIGTTTPVSACDTGDTGDTCDTCDTCDDVALMDHKKGVLASGLRALVSRADPTRDVCSCCDGRAPSPAGFYQPEHAPSPTPGPASDADDRSDHGTAVVGQRLRVVLCDFGFARSANSPFLSSFTRAYISPEVLAMLDQRQHRIALAQNVRVAAARDVWAVGVLVFVLHTRRLPFHELPGEDRRAHRSGITPNMRHTISRGIYTIPKTLSGPACAFLHHVLVVDPRIRPMAATLLLHPWLLGDHVDP